MARKMLLVGAPIVVLGVAGAWFNWARFHSLAEFGHFYLNVRWTDRIQRFGLFNYAFLARNLSAAFTLTPKLLPHKPFFQRLNSESSRSCMPNLRPVWIDELMR